MLRSLGSSWVEVGVRARQVRFARPPLVGSRAIQEAWVEEGRVRRRRVEGGGSREGERRGG